MSSSLESQDSTELPAIKFCEFLGPSVDDHSLNIVLGIFAALSMVVALGLIPKKEFSQNPEMPKDWMVASILTGIIISALLLSISYLFYMVHREIFISIQSLLHQTWNVLCYKMKARTNVDDGTSIFNTLQLYSV